MLFKSFELAIALCLLFSLVHGLSISKRQNDKCGTLATVEPLSTLKKFGAQHGNVSPEVLKAIGLDNTKPPNNVADVNTQIPPPPSPPSLPPPGPSSGNLKHATSLLIPPRRTRMRTRTRNRGQSTTGKNVVSTEKSK